MQPIDIVRGVNNANPTYLQQNVNSSCFAFVEACIAALKAEGYDAFNICKTHGEGQYTPPGHVAFPVTGLDGKQYVCTGFSHDAIWCSKSPTDASLLQVDLVGSGNDSPDPIYDSNGNQIKGTPTWNEIPSQYWRVQNPPYDEHTPPTPVPQPPVGKPYPGDAYFVNNVGVPLEEDYKAAGQQLNAGSATWFSRTIWDYVNGGLSMDESVAKHRKEWRQALGLPEVS